MKYKVKFELELKENPYKGLYIALEGIDGSGKTTQAEELKKFFISHGKEVLLTYEPQRTGVLGDVIHQVLRHEVTIPRESVQYLFAADRAIHMKKVIIPALKKGLVVISDRNFWSSIAYGILDKETQEKDFKREDSEQMLCAMSILSMYHQFITPNHTFYLNVDIKTAMGRIKKMERKAEIYEKEKLLIRAKEIYDWMADKFKGDIIEVNGERHIDEVTKEIIKIVK